MKTCPKRSYSVIENERFGLVFAKTGPIISGTRIFHEIPERSGLIVYPALPFFVKKI